MGTGSCTKSPAWEERRGHGREERGGGVTGRRSRGVTGGRSRGVTGGWSTVGGSRAGGTGGILYYSEYMVFISHLICKNFLALCDCMTLNKSFNLFEP